MNRLCTEWGSVSLNHEGEQLCGDFVASTQIGEDSYVIVLSDGLGSGVKANILATLTGTMMARMVGENIDIDQCVRTVVSTLPVCSERGIAYATFSIVYIRDPNHYLIYNYDNPLPFVYRNNKAELPDYSYLEIAGKRIGKCELSLKENESVILISDGVINAGMGVTINYGWQLPQVMHFIEKTCQPDTSAKAMATILMDHCDSLYLNRPSDDVTCVVAKTRERKRINMMIGPSSNPEDDEKMVSLFLAKKGKRIVSGGTTAGIVARYLNQKVKNLYTQDKGDIPPISEIEGIDLVTEGMITLNKVLEYGKDRLEGNRSYLDWVYQTDGASRIASMLFEEATDINIFLGCAVNYAHQKNKDLNISLKIKLVEELADTLKKMNKNVKINYF